MYVFYNLNTKKWLFCYCIGLAAKKRTLKKESVPSINLPRQVTLTECQSRRRVRAERRTHKETLLTKQRETAFLEVGATAEIGPDGKL